MLKWVDAKYALVYYIRRFKFINLSLRSSSKEFSLIKTGSHNNIQLELFIVS